MTLALGAHRYDVAERALVMGILGPPLAPGGGLDLDACCRRAQRLVDDGADVLDVGATAAEPGPELSEAEELDRVVAAVEAIHARVDVAVSCETRRASVARAAYAAGAVVGNDRSGFADGDYLPAAAAAGASVIGTVGRLAPAAGGGGSHDEGVARTTGALGELAAMARSCGIPAERVLLDAGLDAGAASREALVLSLQVSRSLAATGSAVVLSVPRRGAVGAEVATQAVAVIWGCRVLRAHDARSARRVADVVAAILAAGGTRRR